MKFVATRYEADDEEFVERFEAESWNAAEAHCKQQGWILDGQVMAVISAEHVVPGMSMVVQ